ncbi:MAG TPA: hypothetical protein VIK52_14785, partial [Opitutaceae bacterium]
MATGQVVVLTAAPHTVVALLAEHDVVAFFTPEAVALAAIAVADIDREVVAGLEPTGQKDRGINQRCAVLKLEP